jgi:hypothetical protein
MSGLIWSFLPWVAFLLGVRIEDVYWGAGAGLLVAVVVFGRALAQHKVHLFDVIGVVYFGGMLALLGAIHPDNIGTWGRYAQAVAHGSLTVIVFASILVNRPFTEPYAREQAPRQVWDRPEFKALNRKISLVFGGAFLIGTASLVAAGSSNDLQFVLRIVVPFGALFGALTFAQKQGNAAQSGAGHSRTEPSQG